MSTAHTIDVRELINNRSLGRYQKLIVFLGFCMIALDGFDVAALSFIAPELRTLWGIDSQALGPVFSAALLGLAIGALVAGPLADKLGRKLVLVASVFFFGFWTLATAWSADVTQLILLRFLTGLGLGASMPNVGTLIAEFAPEKKKSFLVTVAFCGFTFGAAGGGFLSAWMLPHYGWQSILILGGVLPILFTPVLLLLLPESVRFMVVKQKAQQRIRRVIEKIAPGSTTEHSRFVMASAVVTHQSSIGVVLSPTYRFGTYMLWLAYFMALFVVYLIGSWLPTLVKESGYSVAEAALITACFQIGGTAGSLFCGWSMDRAEPHKILFRTYFVGSLLLFGLGLVAHSFALLAVLALMIGFCFNGANTGMNALSAGYYPTEARATGSSWMHGVGRWGAILSGFAGAQMLAMGLGFSQVFALLALPALITAVALYAKGRKSANPLAAAMARVLAQKA